MAAPDFARSGCPVERTPSNTDYPPARVETILRSVQAEARADIRSRNWMEDAACRVLADIGEHLITAIEAREDEQSDLLQRRKDVGLDAQAREHAIRARTHRADKDLIREALGVGYRKETSR